MFPAESRNLSPPAMFILASESPRRKQLLAELGYPFSVQAASVNEMEYPDNGYSVFDLPVQNALLKAVSVAEKNPDALVLGADTAIIFREKMLGKPRDLEDAQKMLQQLSGKEHIVMTGIALIRSGKNPVRTFWSEQSTVRFKKLYPDVIASYLAQVNVLDKAGAYAVQECGNLIIESISGDRNNIIGLPLQRLAEKLAEYLQKK